MQGLELDRVTDQGKLAGVCAGVADRWRIDPLLVRVSAVVLGLFSGIGAVLYAAGWALLPVRGSKHPPLMKAFPAARKVPTWGWIAIVGALSAITFAILSPIMPFSTGPVIVIAALWYFAIYRPGRKRKAQGADQAQARTAQPGTEEDPEFPPYVPPPADAPPRHWGPPPHPHFPPHAAHPHAAHTMGAHFSGPPPAAPHPHHAPHTEPDRPAQPSGSGPSTATKSRPAAVRVRNVSFIAAGVLVLVLGALDGAGVVAVSMGVYAASALLVVGVGLVVSAWTGRARALLPVGCGLAAMTLIGLGSVTAPSVVALPDEGGSVGISYDSVREMPDADYLEAGNLTVDLSQLTVTSDHAYEANVDAGTLTVVIPRGTNLEIDGRSDIGSVTMLGEKRSGIDMTQRMVLDPNPGGPVLTLHLRVDLGNLVVRYA